MAHVIFQPNKDLYDAARSGTVIVRHRRGVLRGIGVDRLDLLHRLSTNATRDLKPGGETSTILTSDKGRIVDVLRVLAFDGHILLISDDADAADALAFLDKYTIMDDFAASDVGDQFATFGLYGDDALRMIAELSEVEPPNAGRLITVELGGGHVHIMRDARLNGSGGFLLLADVGVDSQLVERLKDLDAVEIDEPTYETLRIESGLPAPGSELSDQYNPLEAGLTTLINWTKGCYIGQEVIARLDSYDKVQRHLVGLTFESAPESLDAEQWTIWNADEAKTIGSVTSVAYSPQLDRSIALAYIRTEYAIPGATLDVVVDEDASRRVATATITRLPFDV